jgi:hypothetical protein
MYLTASARLLIFATLFSLAAAVGINCAGGSCGPPASTLTRAIEGIDPGRWFANGEQIACATVTIWSATGPTSSSSCAFLQNTGGAWGSRILELAHYLQDHGCQSCGSVPYYYPEDNDVSHGELTYNAVRRPCSSHDGLCYVTTASSSLGRVNIRAFIVPTSKPSLLTVLISQF